MKTFLRYHFLWASLIVALVIAASILALRPAALAQTNTPVAVSNTSGAALYLSGSASTSTSSTAVAVSLGALTAPSGNTNLATTIFDAGYVNVVIVNPSGTGQNITSGNLTLSDTLGALTPSIVYTLSNVSIAPGASQQFLLPLNSAVLKTVTLNLTYAANPSIVATVSALAVFSGYSPASTASDTLITTNGAGGPVSPRLAVQGLIRSTNPASASPYVAARTPDTFKTLANDVTSGNTAIWTPASGRKFRLIGYQVIVPGNAVYATTAGTVTVTFQDAAVGMPFTHVVQVGTTATSGVLYNSGWISLGNGVQSSTANNALNVNLALAGVGALTAGATVNVCGVED